MEKKTHGRVSGLESQFFAYILASRLKFENRQGDATSIIITYYLAQKKVNTLHKNRFVMKLIQFVCIFLLSIFGMPSLSLDDCLDLIWHEKVEVFLILGDTPLNLARNFFLLCEMWIVPSMGYNFQTIKARNSKN